MDWEYFNQEIRRLAQTINYRPDIIVGMTRGGVIPARLLASELQVEEMFCLTVRKDGNERKVMTEVLDDLVNEDILLVEDALESGRSLIVAKRYLESKGAKVKTASLYYTSVSEITPDFTLQRTDTIPKFPWE